MYDTHTHITHTHTHTHTHSKEESSVSWGQRPKRNGTMAVKGFWNETWFWFIVSVVKSRIRVQVALEYSRPNMLW